MNSHSIKKNFFLVLILLSQAFFGYSQSTILSFHPAQKQRFIIDYLMKKEISQEILGDTILVNQSIYISYLFEVVEQTKTENKIKASYHKIRYSQNSREGKIAYDSENKTTLEEMDISIKGYDALVGESFWFTVSNKGEIKEVTGTQQILQKMVDAYGIFDENIQKNLYQTLEKQYGHAGTTEMLHRIFGIYPPNAVQAQTSWTSSSTRNSDFPIIAENTFTFNEIINGLASISISSKLSTNSNAAQQESNGLIIQYDLHGSEASSIQIDLTTGMLNLLESKQQTAGTVHITYATENNVQMDWPIQIIKALTIKVIY